MIVYFLRYSKINVSFRQASTFSNQRYTKSIISLLSVFLVHPETATDVMIQTEEHQSLEKDSTGDQKCVQNGWDDFYECYYGILAENVKYKCSLPFIFGQQNTSTNPLKNCTKYSEGYEFFQ